MQEDAHISSKFTDINAPNKWGNEYYCELGNGYYHSKKYERALKCYRKSAEQGHARAQCNLGYMYEKGYGLEQDYAEAVRLYRLSAEQGCSQAQFTI
ncbi:MAG: sel1 repeat family protein [Synergistaceae bacterium]|nr:sel1 repeat family protein [Synergistaceae bacterium]